MAQATFYLSKDGNVSGPFSVEQLEALKRDGTYETFAWVWNSEAPGWNPISPAPPPPTVSKKDPYEEIRSGKHVMPSLVPVRTQLTYHAICHTDHKAVSGVLIEVSKKGFTLLSGSSSSSLPPFGKGGKVRVNLLEQRTGQTQTTSAVIQGFARNAGNWQYELEWRDIPELIAKEFS